jgi:hypothetical protein
LAFEFSDGGSALFRDRMHGLLPPLFLRQNTNSFRPFKMMLRFKPSCEK